MLYTDEHSLLKNGQVSKPLANYGDWQKNPTPSDRDDTVNHGKWIGFSDDFQSYKPEQNF
jgi:hypothetical protein